MMFTNSQVKLMDRPERDAEGNHTGKLRGRPNFDVMLDPSQMTEALEPYRHTPTFIDDSWAGQETVYLRFTTEAECRSKLNAFLATEDTI